MTRQVVATLIALVTLGSLSMRLVAQDVPLVPGATVTDLNPAPGYFHEPSIAINPRNPQQLVAAGCDAKSLPGGALLCLTDHG